MMQKLKKLRWKSFPGNLFLAYSRSNLILRCTEISLCFGRKKNFYDAGTSCSNKGERWKILAIGMYRVARLNWRRYRRFGFVVSHFDLKMNWCFLQRGDCEIIPFFCPAGKRKELFRLGAWKLSSRYRKWMEESVGSALLRSSIYRGKLKIETVFRISFLLYWNKEIIVIQLYIFF